MNTDSINKTISDYLLSDSKTDYAIMIAGDWGCGKTFYAEHELKTLIESHDLKALKVSLYGLRTYEDFYRRILIGHINENLLLGVGFLKKAARIIPSLSGLAEINLSIDEYKKIYSLTDKTVLIVDDLERISKDLSIQEVLGLINEYVEHYNRKVIVLCNDEKRTDMDEFREKTVRYTLKYSPDIRSIYATILKNELTDSELLAFYNHEADVILSIFVQGGKNNIRTLKFIIDVFQKVYKSIPQEMDFKDNILERLLITTALISCEYKSGESLSELKAVRRRTKMSLSGVRHEEDGTAIRLSKKYSVWYSAFEFSDSVAELIQYGQIPEKSFGIELKEIQEYYRRNIVSEESLLLNQLSVPTSIQDNEILPSIEKVLLFVDNGKYNLYQLMQAFALCVKYDGNHWGGFTITEDIKGRFIKAIKLAGEAHVPQEDFTYRIPIWDASDKEAAAKYEEIRDLATRINTEALNKEFKKSQELFVSAIIKNDVEAVHQYSADTYNMKAMRSIDWHSFMRAVNECNNPTACEASDAIIRLIPDTSIIGPDGRDNVIKNLLPGLSEYIKANPTKIRTTFLHELYMHLKEKCERQY